LLDPGAFTGTYLCFRCTVIFRSCQRLLAADGRILSHFPDLTTKCAFAPTFVERSQVFELL